MLLKAAFSVEGNARWTCSMGFRQRPNSKRPLLTLNPLVDSHSTRVWTTPRKNVVPGDGYRVLCARRRPSG
jgi:hypothetical protein